MLERAVDGGQLELDTEPDLRGFGEPFVRRLLRCEVESGESLDADDLAGPEVHDRLEHRAQRIGVEGALDTGTPPLVLGGEPPLLAGLHVELGLEPRVVMLHARVQRARLEQVAHSQQHLGAVERLGEKVLGAGGQRAFLRVGAEIGGEHDHRQEHAVGQRGAQRGEHGDAVEMGHVEVEEEQVGLELQAPLDRLARVRERVHLAHAGGFQHALEQPHVRFPVVDHENPRVGHRERRAGDQVDHVTGRAAAAPQ